MLDNLVLFIRIIEAGSLQTAAEQLYLPASTLTRRLQKLEQQLGCRLLHRSARRNIPTHEGWQYYEQCHSLVNALQQATQHLDETLNQVVGEIRVLAPINLANGVFANAWMSFMQRFPQVNLSLHVSNSMEDLIGRNADLAIRIGKLPDSLLTMRRLAQISKMLLVASPSYVEQHTLPQTPESLHEHALVTSEPLSIWELYHPLSGQSYRITPQPRFSVNDLDLALEAACSGMGIFLCPLNLCYTAMQQGKVVQVLPEWVSKPREIALLWPQQRHVPARVRALIEHLTAFAATHPLLNGQL